MSKLNTSKTGRAYIEVELKIKLSCKKIKKGVFNKEKHLNEDSGLELKKTLKYSI